MKTLLLLAVAGLVCAAAPALMADPKPSLYEIPLKTLDGKAASLREYQGKVMLIVNVASKCGYTKQYTGLEKLHESLKSKGFTVLGFPCNDFGGQEPGTAEEIKSFCATKYQVTFPLFEKLHVKGSDQHPLYLALTGPASPTPGAVKWNFGKFLVGKDGTILKRFDSATAPDSTELVQAIDAALAAK
jgi:glutathione peroxidase